MMTLCRVVVLAAVAITGAPAFGQRGNVGLKKLPVIQQVGVLPVQWRDEEARGSKPEYQKRVDPSFSEAVRDAHRFRVLDDDLIREMWDSPQGRGELVAQYEMQGFALLAIKVEPDVVRMTVKLLSPQLEVFLQESESFGGTKFRSMSKDEMTDALRSLAFKVFNRIPVDVHVTSVQGKYVTLSGGEEQGVAQNDVVDLQRIFISARHPANGTWAKFQSQRLGRAKVIEVKNFASIAEITALSFDGAVEPGDGARIPGIETRAKFVRERAKEQYNRSVENGPVIVQPEGESRHKSAKSPSQNEAMTDGGGNPAPLTAATRAPVAEEPKPEEMPSEAVAPPELPEHVAPSAKGGGMFGFGRERILVGPSLWKASGDADGSAKFPLWLVNSVTLDLDRRPFMGNWWLAASGSLGIGLTGGGTFLGYGFGARSYMEGKLGASSAPLAFWRGGGGVRFDGMRVNAESFGGMDVIRFLGFGSVGGKLDAGGNGIDWESQLTLFPIMFGRVGANGTLGGVSQSIGWELQALGILDEKSSPKWGGFQWGGGFLYGSQNLKSADAEVSYKDLRLLLALERKY